MRWWRTSSVGLKVAIIASAILALSIGGVLTAERFDTSSQDSAVKASETGPDSETAGDDIRLAANPLELGTVAKVGPNYRVAVTAISLYEGQADQVIAATINAKYVGKDDGEPWADLSVEFIESDSRRHGESDCPSGLGHTEASEQTVLATGDEKTFEVCIGLPVSDIKGGQLVIEEAFAESDRAFWSTEAVVTKVLPSPVPASPVRRAPAASPRAAGQDANDGSRCTEKQQEYDEDLDESKEKIDELDERMQAYKNVEGHDEDKVEEWEEDKEEFDERYEEWKDAYHCDD